MPFQNHLNKKNALFVKDVLTILYKKITFYYLIIDLKQPKRPYPTTGNLPAERKSLVITSKLICWYCVFISRAKIGFNFRIWIFYANTSKISLIIKTIKNKTIRVKSKCPIVYFKSVIDEVSFNL